MNHKKKSISKCWMQVIRRQSVFSVINLIPCKNAAQRIIIGIDNSAIIYLTPWCT